MPENIEIGTIKDLKEGRFVVIDGEPCKVVSIDVSKTGKHGAHKANITAISLFTGAKKTLMKPVDANVEIPIILKKAAQITAITGSTLQLMDLQTYELYEVPTPDEFKDKIVAGAEVEIQEVMGKKLITRVKS